MIAKCIEIRDEGTCIPALAIRMRAANDVQDRFLRRCGYPPESMAVVLMRLTDQRATSDPYEWVGSRTMIAAHLYIEEHFDRLTEGAVVDVRVLLGETQHSAPAEIYTNQETP